jgi:PAS domain S-box-containing protein
MGQIGAPRFHLPSGSVALRYGLALVSVAAAFVLAIVWLHFDSPLPFTGFALTAIAITFWYGRTKPGILAVLLATLARSYFFQPATSPVSRLLYDSVFLVFALLMIWLTRWRNELAVKVAERTAELAAANEKLKFEIAERKQAEEALKASERELRRIAEQLEAERSRLVEAQEVAKIGSWELELQSLNVIWSEQTHRIFETDPSRFHPTRPKFLEFIHPKDRAKVDAAFVECLDKRSPCTVEYRIVMPDGRVKSLEERWQVFHDEQGTPVRVAGTCRDITERVRAEGELQQVRERMESILNSVSDTFILFDRRWRYLYLNDAAVRATGRPLEEILGRTLWELFPEVVGSELDRQFRRAMDESVHVEFHFLQPGFDRWWEIRTYPAPEGLAVFATEITERKRADEELKRLSGDLLRSQDEERRRIARDLHDSTGQNLVALATMLGQLRDSIPSAKRESRQLLSKCKALAEGCIREVRTLSYALHPQELDLAGLGAAIREYVDGFTQRSGIHVELELSPSVGRMARDIEVGLFRVVQESLVNIHRHSGSQRAKIRIHRNSELTLEISDYGRGASASTPKGKEKTRFKFGVGIPSMQERVSLIGGRLDIDSSSHGTTVRVTIPLRGEPP